MTRIRFHSLGLALAVIASLAAFPHTLLAGPPLLCWPFAIGEAKSLPWQGPNWRSVKEEYDLNRLVADTLALLTPETPVIVRMETLRRATVYAMKDRRIAEELFSRLKARALEAEKQGKAGALALFDAGYLAEIYKQTFRNNPAAGIDGYAWVTEAIRLRGQDAEMELGAAIISVEPQMSGHREHVQKALAGAADGSLLARNLVSQAPNLNIRGRTLAELRAYVGAAKD